MIVSEYINAIRVRLFDPAPGAGWTDAELTAYLNFTQRRISFIKPDAYTRHASVACVGGATQTLPPDGIALFDIVGNGTTGAAVTQVNEELLKAANRAFRGAARASVIENYATDPRDPRHFLVTPPALPGTTLEIVFGAVPPDVDRQAPGAALPLPESFDSTLLDGVMAQAFAKPGRRQDMERAALHLASFNNAMGVKDRMQQIVTPKVGM